MKAVFFVTGEKTTGSSFFLLFQRTRMTASNEQQAPSAPAQQPPPTLFADPLIPMATCKLLAQGAEAVSKMSF